MRLINAITLQLEEFIGSNIPPYAILSHTWGPHETSLQDYKDCLANVRSPFRNTAGYTKITKACEHSVNQQVEYCWIDTCCIDKSSSAELSEAINSMFQWYAKAQVCLVHLEDFMYDPKQSQREDIDISDCRWLTRGWCLQELIAPKRLLFFDSAWTFAADKTQLLGPLSRLTGVDEGVLSGKRLLSEVAIGSRLSWAAKRQTTRIEDQAYCLLGILDINMPLLYGEGSKAFQRLQHEILQMHDDPSIFAWESNSSDPYQEMLAPTIECFQNFGRIGSSSPWRTTDQMFSYTSKGIRVTSTKLKFGFVHGKNVRPYVLTLGDLVSPINETPTKIYQIRLLKIKPRMYVRLSKSADMSYGGGSQSYAYRPHEDIYIIPTKDAPSISQMASGSAGARIELEGRLSKINHEFEQLGSRDIWDDANSRFLIAGTPRRSPLGHVKIWTNGERSRYFILSVWLPYYELPVEFYLISSSRWETQDLILLSGVDPGLLSIMLNDTTSIVKVRQAVEGMETLTRMKIGPVTITATLIAGNTVNLSCSEGKW